VNTDHVIIRLLLLFVFLNLGRGIIGGSGGDRSGDSKCFRICEVFFRL
jgi:hypothetical protein